MTYFKDVLQNGDIVEYDDGRRALFIGEDFIAIDGWISSIHNHDNRTGTSLNHFFNIVKIYRKTGHRQVDIKNLLYRDEILELVWKVSETLLLSDALTQFDIVEYRNGKRAVLIGDKFISYTGYMSKDEYQENGKTKSKTTDSDYDIIRIFRLPSLDSFRVGFAAVLGRSDWTQLNAQLIWKNY